MSNTKDRDGLVIYRGDSVARVEPDTGKVIATGVVTAVEGSGKVRVRWGRAPKDCWELAAEIVVTPGGAS